MTEPAPEEIVEEGTNTGPVEHEDGQDNEEPAEPDLDEPENI